MDNYLVDHEMSLHLMQRKSEWKTSKSSKWSTKIQILNTLEQGGIQLCLYQQWSGEENQLPCMFICFSAHKWCTCLFQCCWIIWSVYDNFVVNFTFLFSSLAIIDLSNIIISVVTMLRTIIIYLNQFSQQNYFKIPKVSEYSPNFPIFPQNSQYSRWKFTALKIPGNFASLIERKLNLQWIIR